LGVGLLAAIPVESGHITAPAFATSDGFIGDDGVGDDA
jgi:hypothetical protein